MFEMIEYTRTTDMPGSHRGGYGYQPMKAGDLTYIVTYGDLSYRVCTREPRGIWVNPNQDVVEGEWWVKDKEQTAAFYDFDAD